MVLTPFGDTFWPFCVPLYTLKLNKSNLRSKECLKYIITCLYQLVFMFFPIFRLQIYIVCRITGDFVILTPFGDTFWSFCVLLHNLRLDKLNLTSIECLKCIITCLYQLVFMFFFQFLDFKFT